LPSQSHSTKRRAPVGAFARVAACVAVAREEGVTAAGAAGDTLAAGADAGRQERTKAERAL
jgi:hypothetical protein